MKQDLDCAHAPPRVVTCGWVAGPLGQQVWKGEAHAPSRSPPMMIAVLMAEPRSALIAPNPANSADYDAQCAICVPPLHVEVALWARKVGQIVGRRRRTWLVRVYNGHDPETKQRKYLNQTIHGGLGRPGSSQQDARRARPRPEFGLIE
jgi:hypothetical protein